MLLGVLGIFSSDTYGQEGRPTAIELAAMGLSGIQVLSDAEAAQVRVRGSVPSRWGNLYPFLYGLRRLERPEPLRAPAYLVVGPTIRQAL